MTKTAKQLQEQRDRQRRYAERLKKQGINRRWLMVPEAHEDDWQKTRDRLLKKWAKAGSL